MSIFTLGITCLTLSDLPWFMDLTFQVLIQCYSLQHQSFLPSTVTSATGCCFCFLSIPSLFLEFLLHWTPIVYWESTHLGSSSFCMLYFAFECCLWDSQGRIMMRFSNFFLRGPHFVRTLYHDPLVLGDPTWMAHTFFELDKAMAHVIRLISFLWSWLWLWFSFYLPSDE